MQKVEQIVKDLLHQTKPRIRWMLALYDVVVLAFVDILLLHFYKGAGPLEAGGIIIHYVLSFLSVFLFRFTWKIYNQIWRYGGIQCYIRLLVSDGCALGFIPC